MSRLLLAIQFALILLLLLPVQLEPMSSPASLLLLAVGGMLGLWTLWFNRIGNFNIRPEPRERGKLVTEGPYRFVRHPMYVAVLLVMAPFGLLSGEPFKAVCWVLLLAVLWKKASVEEAMLQKRFEQYERYMQSTGRFLPRISRRRKDG